MTMLSFTPLPDVNVSLCHRPLQPAVYQLVVYRLIAGIDRGMELTRGQHGHRGYFLKSLEVGMQQWRWPFGIDPRLRKLGMLPPSLPCIQMTLSWNTSCIKYDLYSPSPPPNLRR